MKKSPESVDSGLRLSGSARLEEEQLHDNIDGQQQNNEQHNQPLLYVAGRELYMDSLRAKIKNRPDSERDPGDLVVFYFDLFTISANLFSSILSSLFECSL